VNQGWDGSVYWFQNSSGEWRYTSHKDVYLSRTGGGGGSDNGGSGSDDSGPPLNEQQAEQYGLTVNMLNAFPELKDLFRQATDGQWTTDRFQAEFRNSDFYKTRSDSQRKAVVEQYTDPATYGQLWNVTQNHIRTLMGDMGSDSNNWANINEIAGHVIFDGWTDEQARNKIGEYITFGTKGLAAGKAGITQQNLNSYAYSMGVHNADWWIQNAVRQVSTGMKTEQDFKNEIMAQAIAAFPQFEDNLKSGQTMSDVAQPYMQSMSQILEIAPGSVNLFDPTIRKALSFKDPSTGDAGSQPLWDFQNSLRQDDRWGKTQNAQDAAMGTAHKVLQDFGVAY
jgi:hypothetical protein